MKRNKILAVFMLATVMTTNLLGASTVYAAPTTGDSDADVELKEGGGTIGPLTIENVTNFDFGVNELSSKEETYTAKVDGDTSISDLRGTGVGWSLLASITDFTAQDTTGHTLIGAELTLPAGTPVSDGSSSAPVSSETVLNNQSQNVLDAVKDSGLGVWKVDYTGTTLKVPSGSYAGQYTSTITWTLQDAPVTP